MRTDKPSRTAAWVAAARGLGVLLPDSIRLASDPYGLAFASPRLQRWIDRLRRDGPHAIATAPGIGEWVLYMQVRTRVLDDAVRGFAARGGDQIVILGAGYDCRALRLDDLGAARAAVYEIDHPATQRDKADVLARIGARSPARTIEWDFESRPMDELPAALAAAGHDPGRPTLALWEGVTMYLTEAAIDASVRAMARWSAAGSELAMTYFQRGDKMERSLPTRALAALVARIGEPWRWGWDPAELPDWMAARGFRIVRDVTMAAAAAELLPPELAGRIGDPTRRYAIASRDSIALAGRDADDVACHAT